MAKRHVVVKFPETVSSIKVKTPPSSTVRVATGGSNTIQAKVITKSILVSATSAFFPSPSLSIDDLQDINLTNLQDEQFLQWDADSNTWINATVAPGGGGTVVAGNINSEGAPSNFRIQSDGSNGASWEHTDKKLGFSITRDGNGLISQITYSDGSTKVINRDGNDAFLSSVYTNGSYTYTKTVTRDGNGNIQTLGYS